MPNRGSDPAPINSSGQTGFLTSSRIGNCRSNHDGTFFTFDYSASPADFSSRLENKCELIRDFVTEWYEKLHAEIGNRAEPANYPRPRFSTVYGR